jgi:hypothetical protein
VMQPIPTPILRAQGHPHGDDFEIFGLMHFERTSGSRAPGPRLLCGLRTIHCRVASFRSQFIGQLY